MAQLVHLVVAHRLHAHASFNFRDILGRCGNGGDAGARKRDFRRAGEFKIAVRVAGRLARSGDIGDMFAPVVVEMMHAIRVVPENAEVARGAGHFRKAMNRFVGIRDAGGVGVLRHAPYALDGIVFGDKSLDFVHVGTVFVHRDGNHFDAVAFGNAEVAIVAGHGAEPLYFRKLAPRRTAQIAVRVSSGYQVEHDVEA